MNFWKSIAGMVRIRITSASVTRVLSAINDAGIAMENTVWVDDLSVETTIMRHQYKHVKSIVECDGNAIQLIKRYGLYWQLSAIRSRPMLLFSLALYAAMVMFLPTRIFFVTVTGNNTVSTEMILTQAEAAGVRFGAYKKLLRSEKIKNALLSAIPELQWAGVNTKGCVAEISVREGDQKPETEQNCGVRSVVAKYDGIIQEVTVTKGNVLCKIGDVVKKGQILVSGYTDCGIQIKATAAEAEIYAQTVHSINSITPLVRQFRLDDKEEIKHYSIIFGKKLIKLYKGSGISDTRCVKMYTNKYLTLPGGFQLPLGLLVETRICYDTAAGAMPKALAGKMVAEQVRQYLGDTMIAGQILSERNLIDSTNDTLTLSGCYNCREMIGQIYYEEIIDGNEQRD